jgi:putative endonuclease
LVVPPSYIRRKAYRFGLRAEKIAAWYLRLKGYRILAERYHIQQGEIDVLATKGDVLAAVEVKARKSFDACEISITPHKQQKILKAVQHVLSGSGKFTGLQNPRALTIRFDAVWIVPRRWPRHIINAWSME